MTVRSVGIEEELLLVHPVSGCPLAVASAVLERAGANAPTGDEGLGAATPRPFGKELQQQQLEARTRPRTDLYALAEDVDRARQLLTTAAEASGAVLLAVGTSPLPARPTLTRNSRYFEMALRYGLTVDEHLTCGCHVHVSVDSAAEAVGVLDRIRIWLPVLLAISANSPFWQGRDTRYASYRSQALARWPSSGPTDVFGSATAYHALVSSMVSSGVLIDEGMVYFDARLSRHYPTVEIRIADVCLDARDAILLAALCRGLVETAACDWADKRPAPAVPTTLLRLATWQAGRYGLDGSLLDPRTTVPRAAPDVLIGLLEHIGPALQINGDAQLATDGLNEVLSRGNGARQQRSALGASGGSTETVHALAHLTSGAHR